MLIRFIKITTFSFIAVVMMGCAGNSPQSKDGLANTAAVGTSSETAAKVGQMSLTEALVRQLGVTETQAQGGAGAIMQYTKDSLSPGDFSEVASAVPDMDNLLSAAPSTSGISSQAMSAVTGSTGNLGGAAELASAFQQLNLSPDMVSQFTPVIANYVKTYGGDQAASLLKPILSGLL